MAGKSLGVPVFSLLGGCYRSRISLTKSIGMNIPEDPEKIKTEAAEIAKQGWRVEKLKGSGNPDEDILRVKAAREGIEEARARIPIQIDPNCGYSGDDVALRAFRVMETFNLDLIEQPLPRWDFRGMTELCRALDTPIMADESIVTIRDAATIFKQKVADVLNVKQQKAGGLYRALQIAGLAECAKLPVVIGALHDTGISQSASVHLAAACPTLRYPCDLRTPLSQAESVIRDPLVIEDGEIICAEKPGLGIEVDEAVLDKYTLQKVVVKG